MRLELDAADMATLAAMVASRVLEELLPAKPAGCPLTPKQAGERLGLCERSIREMAARGKLARVPGTGKILIPESEIQRVLTTQTENQKS